MELFLNILWVLIVLTGACVWRMRWAHHPRARQHEAWRQWTAFACAMVLLFFVVSLTDDLHAELVLFEESWSSRRHAMWHTCQHHSPRAVCATAPDGSAILPASPLVVPVVFSIFIFQLSEDFRPRLTAEISSGRDPPVFTL
jgi:hypothetical protein